jgi:predicted ester cyclase
MMIAASETHATSSRSSPRGESGKALVRRFIDDVLSAGNPRAIDDLIAPNAIISLPTGRFVGPEAVRRAIAEMGSVYPDLRIELRSLIAEGDRVAAEWSLCGTERRELLGVPPSGQWTCISGLSFSRIAGNQIVEHRMIEG